MRRALSRRTILLAATSALLALAWAAAPAHALQLGPSEAHSPNAEAINGTYWVMFVIVAALIVIVNGALIFAVVRFRERRGREAAQVHAGRGALRPIVGVLGVLALAIFVFGVIRTGDVRSVEPSGPNGLGSSPTTQVGVNGVAALATSEADAAASDPTDPDPPTGTDPLVIDAFAQQWIWRFVYPGDQPPGQRTFSYAQLVVPVDTTVILNVTSTDVLHSWWIPALGGQVQATPGEVVQTWFKADEVGTYSGNSTVFSGTSFPAMRMSVKVVSVPEYQAYVNKLAEDLKSAQDFVHTNQPPPAAG
jgi:cytochrome c oxidase subunit 2